MEQLAGRIEARKGQGSEQPETGLEGLPRKKHTGSLHDCRFNEIGDGYL